MLIQLQHDRQELHAQLQRFASQTGEFDPKDLDLLQQFGTWYASLYNKNLLKGESAAADSTWSNPGFEAGKAVDDDICSYWAAGNGKTSASLTVTPAAQITVNLISIREAIELGERVTKYHVEIKQNGNWVTPSDATDSAGNAKVQGTVIVTSSGPRAGGSSLSRGNEWQVGAPAGGTTASGGGGGTTNDLHLLCGASIPP